jgi:hypothetical protein
MRGSGREANPVRWLQHARSSRWFVLPQRSSALLDLSNARRFAPASHNGPGKERKVYTPDMVAWLEAELAPEEPAGRQLIATIVKVFRSRKGQKDYGAKASELLGDSLLCSVHIRMLKTADSVR